MKNIIVIVIVILASGFNNKLYSRMQQKVMNDTAKMKTNIMQDSSSIVQNIKHETMKDSSYSTMKDNKPDTIDGNKNCIVWGMMMNNRPMHNNMGKYAMLVKKLPQMQIELSLTDDQVNKLIDLQADFIKKKADLRANLVKNQLKLHNLLNNSAPAKEVSDQLKINAGLQTDISAAAYETAISMKNVLNQKQLQKLDNMWNQFKGNTNEEDDE